MGPTIEFVMYRDFFLIVNCSQFHYDSTVLLAMVYRNKIFQHIELQKNNISQIKIKV